MKKNQIFTLLSLVLFTFSCDEDVNSIDSGFKFTFDNPNVEKIDAPHPIQSFLFLFDKDENFLEYKETTFDNTKELSASKAGKYSVGLFRNNRYTFIHEIPNKEKLNLNPYYRNSFLSQNIIVPSELIIENLDSYESLLFDKTPTKSPVNLPAYNAQTKELSYYYGFNYLDMVYICVREHKDSSFRYALLKTPPLSDSNKVSKIYLDYTKMKKAKVVTFKPKYEEYLYFQNLVAKTDDGYFNIYDNMNYWDWDSKTLKLVLPEEKINSFYVDAVFSATNSYVFYDKLDNMDNLKVPVTTSIEPNGVNTYKIIGEKPVMLRRITWKENFNFSNPIIDEFLPYIDDNTINLPVPKIPLLLEKATEINNLSISSKVINLYFSKDKNYSTMITKMHKQQNVRMKFDTWLYDNSFTLYYYDP